MLKRSIQLTLLSALISCIGCQTHGDYGPNGEGQILWHYKPAGSDVFDWCQPAIVHNEKTGQRIIIFGDGDEIGGGRLYAVDADTHKAVWGPISFDGPIGNSPITLSSDGKRGYFGEGSKPGKLKWESERTGGEIFGAPVIGVNGEIYVGAADHYLYVYQPPVSATSTVVTPLARYFWKDRWPVRS